MASEEASEERFRIVFRGYDPDEVDEVLRTARNTAAALQARIHVLEAKLAIVEENGISWPLSAHGAAELQRADRRLPEAEARLEAALEREAAIIERIRRLQEVLEDSRQSLEEILGADLP